MTLQDTFYLVGIIYMILFIVMFVIIIGFLFFITNKIRDIHAKITDRVDSIADTVTKPLDFLSNFGFSIVDVLLTLARRMRRG